MTGLLFLAAVALVVSICLSAFVQILYVESLRLRTRETPALEFFKETLEDRLGWKTEQGALAFALFKHTGLILLGIVFLLIASVGASQWNVGEAALLSFCTMLLAAHIVPQMLYRRASARWLLGLIPPLRLMALVMKPFTLLLGFMQSLAELSEREGQQEDEQTPAGKHRGAD